MNQFENIRTALLAKAPALAAEYSGWVRRAHARIAEAKGAVPSSLAAWDADYLTISRLLRPVCDTVLAEGSRVKGTLTINEAKLSAVANRYAEAAAQEWFLKIVAKLGEVDDVSEGLTSSNSDLRISCTKQGRKVYLDQQRVMKSSPKGVVFNQFPARLYVDGKFTPEAQFKKLFA